MRLSTFSDLGENMKASPDLQAVGAFWASGHI